MATGFENKERNLIPNWRSFRLTAALGEINDYSNINERNENSLEDQLLHWQNNKSIGVAANLISSAYSTNQYNLPEVQEASKYILQHNERSNNILDSIANRILKSNHASPNDYLIHSDAFKVLANKDEFNNLYSNISRLKKQLANNPRNSIAWVELSRYYIIIGNETKAVKAMSTAYALSQSNRFVLRSLVRLLTGVSEHVDSQIGFAHNALRKAPNLTNDPWLLAAEIGLSSKRSRTSKYVKQGFQLIGSNKFSPFQVSELTSALAMVELKNGSHKKSKDLFLKSLVDPNDNALAQAEWISEKESFFHALNAESFNVKRSYEALAIDSFQRSRWKESIEFAKKWFIDMPYSKRSILFGHHISEVYLKDHGKAIDFCRLGLISHPNDKMLMNDLAYSYCLNGQLQNAEVILKRANVSQHDSAMSKVCLTATSGLLQFRKGNVEAGRRLYSIAAEEAKSLQNRYTLALALLNYVREEVNAKTQLADSLITKVDLFLKGVENKDLIILKNDIVRQYNSQKDVHA